MMRHYEIVLMLHPDRNEKVIDMIVHYKRIIDISKGYVHRLENWGRRTLSYPIKKLHQAHYILMNIEVSSNIIDDLEHAFRFDHNIIRNMIMHVQYAITEQSSMMKMIKESENNVFDKNTVS